MKKQKIAKKHISLVGAIVVVLVAGVILTAGGFAFAATQEQNDGFCASCHSQPESTFYQRSTASSPVDNASYHTTKKVNCIDCHSGVGVMGRVSAELMGARNALLWISGTATQPAPLTVPINDENCLKCHQVVTQKGYTIKNQITLPGLRFGNDREAPVGHWHQNMARWQAASTTAKHCVDCHNGHVEGSTAQAGFMASKTVSAVCDACHRVLRHGD